MRETIGKDVSGLLLVYGSRSGVVIVQCNNSQGRVNDLAGVILVHSGFVPNSLTKRCACVCVGVCESTRICLSPCLRVCVHTVKRAQVLKRMKLTGARFVRSVPLAIDGQRCGVQSVIWLF